MHAADRDAADVIISNPDFVVKGDRSRCEGVFFIDLPGGVVERLLGIGISQPVRRTCGGLRGSRGRESSLEFGKRAAAREQELVEAIDRGAERREDLGWLADELLNRAGHPEVVVDTRGLSPALAAHRIFVKLEAMGFIR